MKSVFVISGALLLACVAGRSDAQPTPLDAREFQVNSYTTDLQGLGTVARGPDGGFVVVWTSEGSPGSDTDGYSVQAQRFDTNGRRLGVQFQVNTYTTGDQFAGTVASDESGNFVVVWESKGSFGTDSDGASVQARRFRADETALDPAELQVNTYTTGDQEFAQVAVRPNGDFVVVWSGGPFWAYDVHARRYRADGAALDPVELQVNSYTTGDQRAPQVAASPDGGFVVVWTSEGSFGSDDSEESVQARRFAADGIPLDANELQVNVFTPGPQHLPAVAAGPRGGFVVTWDSDYGTGTDPFLSIQARRFGADGAPLDASEFQVNEYTPNGQFRSRVAMSAGGDCTVVWTSIGSLGDDDDQTSIQARRFHDDGSAVDAAESQVNVYTTYDQFAPEIAATPDGDCRDSCGKLRLL